MFKHNFLTYGSQLIAKTAGEIVYFPFWWYGVGFLETLKKLGRFWLGQEQALGFSVWLKNIFVPMYGQADLAGRLISFFIRFVQIIFRGLALLFWLIFVFIGVLLWLVAPLFLVIAFIFQIGG